MQIILNQPCNPISFLGFSSSSSFKSHATTKYCDSLKAKSSDDAAACGVRILSSISAGTSAPRCDFWTRRYTHISFNSKNGVSDDFSSTEITEVSGSSEIRENEELGLLNKPNPAPITTEVTLEDGNELEKNDGDEILEPFLKFFKPKDESDEAGVEESESGGDYDERKERNSNFETENEIENFDVEYYDPKPGDFVIGVVVSGNENKLDVNIGADFLGTMLTKEVLPLYDKEMDYLLCDLKHDAEEFTVHGKMGIVKDDDAIDDRGRGPGRPVVEAGNVIFAEVLGRTLSGRPLLSTRRYFRRIAWHRVRQIKQLNEPIEVRITEWNTGGLLTRIEGLRAFLPKAELVKKVNSFTEMKENVGRKLFVTITRINEDTNDLILSEKAAWEKLNLKEGTLLDGTIVKILPYGAQVKIGESNRSGLLHISNITRSRITSASDVLMVDEKVKVLVVKSLFPDKISLSIADLESKPGLFISNREMVFAEADEMAKKYRKKLPTVPANHKQDPPLTCALSFDHEEGLYANWNWFRFEDSDNESK